MTLNDRTPSGYQTHDEFFATKYAQGGRTFYSMELTLAQLVSYIPKPDATKPLETQRQINLVHAKSFANYIRQQEHWIAPALLLRAPPIFDFEEFRDVSAAKFGFLKVPKTARSDIKIIDGQHRILGVYLATEANAEEIEAQRNTLSRARREEDTNAIQLAESKLARLVEERERLNAECIPVQIVIIDDTHDAKRVFVDIADNALGIRASVRVRFDDRKVVNRALEDVMEHPLLKDRVDLQADMVRGSSPRLVAAKHVADIIRAVQVGNGRIGKRLEAELREADLVANTKNFLDGMVAAFPDLQGVQDDELAPSDLRATSLLGSPTMIRVFAAMWHDLKGIGFSDRQSIEALGHFEGNLQAPVLSDLEDTWYATGFFSETDAGSFAPTSRAQDLRGLTEKVLEWALVPPEWKRV